VISLPLKVSTNIVSLAQTAAVSLVK
jgi:hypothetical protein